MFGGDWWRRLKAVTGQRSLPQRLVVSLLLGFGLDVWLAERMSRENFLPLISLEKNLFVCAKDLFCSANLVPSLIGCS
jgi:hypothetical protein